MLLYGVRHWWLSRLTGTNDEGLIVTRLLVWLNWVALTLTFALFAALIYLAFIQRIDPLERQSLVSVDGVRVAGHATLVITREFCMAKERDGVATRTFRRVPAGPGDLEDVYELPVVPIRLLAGCHRRPRTVELPDIMLVRAGDGGPHRYVYESSIRFCNELRCVDHRLPAVALRIDTFEGRHRIDAEELLGPAAPPREN